MIPSRTHRRRASGRHAENGDGDPSFLESLASYFTDRVARSALRRARHGVREVVRWSILRMVLGWIGATILTVGILLLFGAAVKGLEALHCPPWLTYLLTGATALLVAVIAMKDILWPKTEEEDD